MMSVSVDAVDSTAPVQVASPTVRKRMIRFSTFSPGITVRLPFCSAACSMLAGFQPSASMLTPSFTNVPNTRDV